MHFLLSMGIFHCYVSLPECNRFVRSKSHGSQAFDEWSGALSSLLFEKNTPPKKQQTIYLIDYNSLPY